MMKARILFNEIRKRNKMKRRKLVVIVLVAITAVVGCSSVIDKKSSHVETMHNEAIEKISATGFPSFVMQNSNGDTVNLQSLKGKKVFVNLWASWCPPCRAEMPSIEKLYASINKNKVAFVMLSYDKNPNAALKFMRSNKLSLPIFFPTEQPPAIFNTDGIPATFIFNEKGELIKQNTGAEDYDTNAYRQLLQ